MGELFARFGINAPGKVNVFLDGRFQTVNLDELPDEKLKQLYEANCSYVQLTDKGRKLMFPESKPIEVATINHEKKPAKHSKKKDIA